MKKCFIMFLFFVLMLLIAALTDNTQVIIQENQGDEYANIEIPMTGDQVRNTLATD